MSHERGNTKFLALTFPFIEKSIFANKAFLKEAALELGSSVSMEPFMQERLISKVERAPYFSLGGKLILAMGELARRGHECSILGKVGTDSASRFYKSALMRSDLIDKLALVDGCTSQRLTVHAPNGQKARAYYLGASLELDAFDLSQKLFDSVHTLFLDASSFLWGYLPLKAAEMVKKEGGRVCFFLDSISEMTPYYDQIAGFIQERVDLLVVTEIRLESLLKTLCQSKEHFLASQSSATLLICSKGMHRLYTSGESVSVPIQMKRGQARLHEDDWFIPFCNLFQKDSAMPLIKS